MSIYAKSPELAQRPELTAAFKQELIGEASRLSDKTANMERVQSRTALIKEELGNLVAATHLSHANEYPDLLERKFQALGVSEGSVHCPICWGDLVEGDKNLWSAISVSGLPEGLWKMKCCPQLIHKTCIRDWLADHRTCSYCVAEQGELELLELRRPLFSSALLLEGRRVGSLTEIFTGAIRVAQRIAGAEASSPGEIRDAEDTLRFLNAELTTAVNTLRREITAERDNQERAETQYFERVEQLLAQRNAEAIRRTAPIAAPRPARAAPIAAGAAPTFMGLNPNELVEVKIAIFCTLYLSLAILIIPRFKIDFCERFIKKPECLHDGSIGALQFCIFSEEEETRALKIADCYKNTPINNDAFLNMNTLFRVTSEMILDTRASLIASFENPFYTFRILSSEITALFLAAILLNMVTSFMRHEDTSSIRLHFIRILYLLTIAMTILRCSL